jgi:hypothetical protein
VSQCDITSGGATQPTSNNTGSFIGAPGKVDRKIAVVFEAADKKGKEEDLTALTKLCRQDIFLTN